MDLESLVSFKLTKPAPSLEIDHASLAEKSARKDENTLCWPPPN